MTIPLHTHTPPFYGNFQGGQTQMVSNYRKPLKTVETVFIML